MPTNTPNLNLIKPLVSEKYTVAVANANNDILDTAVGDVYTKSEVDTQVGLLAPKANPVFTGTQTLPNIVTNGIKFPATQVPSGDPNTFDDYEEGSWTPTTPTPNVNVTVNAAFYTKIGRQVFAYCFVTLTNTSASTISPYSITGLPFLSIIFGEVSSYYDGIRPIFSFIEANTIEAKLGQDLNVGDNSRMFSFSYVTN